MTPTPTTAALSSFFKKFNDKPRTQSAAAKLLEIYKQIKLEPKNKDELERDARGG